MIEAAVLVAQKGNELDINFTLNGIVALIAGVLILIFPRLLSFLVAGYLIVVGLIQVFDFSL
ncbi:MAG: DUF3096 domain-containing protein [Actinobacteria bacterium]|nr:DUF3096 domain-containing protein [Actinomycetota bacterium]